MAQPLSSNGDAKTSISRFTSSVESKEKGLDCNTNYDNSTDKENKQSNSEIPSELFQTKRKRPAEIAEKTVPVKSRASIPMNSNTDNKNSHNIVSNSSLDLKTSRRSKPTNVPVSKLPVSKSSKLPISKPTKLPVPKVRKDSMKTVPLKPKPTISPNSTFNQSVNKETNLEKKNKKGETPLHSACVKGCLETVQTLLSRGSNPNTQDFNGWTPLHEAVSQNRLDISKLLLEASALPSVPAGEFRITALHDAVGSNMIDMIKLLVSFGADKDVRNSKGITPRIMASTQGSEVMNIFENEKIAQEKTLPLEHLEPQDMILCFSKKICAQSKVAKALTDIVIKMGCRKPSSKLSEITTHYIIEDEEADLNVSLLSSVLLGVEIVRKSWILKSSDKDSFMKWAQFRSQGEWINGWKQAVKRKRHMQPGLLDGLHVYLKGTFDPPGLNREEVQSLVRLAGGKLLNREPDPEFIPSSEDSLPHHVSVESTLASTSHVILYMTGSRTEPLLKYNMLHVKTLPLSWLLKCICQGSIVDP